MSRFRSFLCADRGALVLEMALVTPILIIIFAAIAQFGFAFYVQSTLQSAVRSAARDASLGDAFVAATPAWVDCASTAFATVEDEVCEYLINTDLFADAASYQVRTEEIGSLDPDASGPAVALTNMLRVDARVLFTSVIFLDFNGFIASKSGTYLDVYAIMQREPS